MPQFAKGDRVTVLDRHLGYPEGVYVVLEPDYDPGLWRNPSFTVHIRHESSGRDFVARPDNLALAHQWINQPKGGICKQIASKLGVK